MKTKLVLKCLLWLFASIIPCDVVGATNVSSGTKTKRLSTKGDKPILPRDVNSDSDNVVECTVDNGWIIINFERPEGMARVTLSEMGQEEVFSNVYNTCMEIRFPYSSGSVVPVYILVSTSEGNEYEGWIDTDI